MALVDAFMGLFFLAVAIAAIVMMSYINTPVKRKQDWFWIGLYLFVVATASGLSMFAFSEAGLM